MRVPPFSLCHPIGSFLANSKPEEKTWSEIFKAGVSPLHRLGLPEQAVPFSIFILLIYSGRQTQENNGAYLKPLGVASADPLSCSLLRHMVLCLQAVETDS